MQIDGSTSGVAARCGNHKLSIVNCALSIIHCPLSIIHYPLLILLFSFLFVDSLSAQDNYTVVVKCTPISGQSGYMVKYAKTTNVGRKLFSGSAINKNYGTRQSSSTTWSPTSTPTAPAAWTSALSSSSYVASYSCVTGQSIIANYMEEYGFGPSASQAPITSTTTKLSPEAFKNVTESRSTKAYTRTVGKSTSQVVGFANFNIANLPTKVTVAGALLSYSQYSEGSQSLTAYRITTTPSANNAAAWEAFNTGSWSSSYCQYSATTSGMHSHYLIPAYTGNINYTTSWDSWYSTNYPWISGTYTLSNSTFYTSYYDKITNLYRGTASNNSGIVSFYMANQELEKARSSNISSFGIAFAGYSHSYYTVGMQAKSNSMSLKITYIAPWSAAITPSAGIVSSVCSGDPYTLSALMDNNNPYVSITPTSWAWYSATASNGAYSLMGSTNQSTYAVTAPSNTGSIWYKYNQSINMMSNNTLETKASSYSITFCNPGSIYVSQCCTSLGSSPSFSATQVRDRSVNLQWSGMDHVDHYVIRYGVDGGVSFKEIIVDRNTTSKLIERLTNGRSYFFQIQAIGASGYCDTQLSTKIYLTPNCQ